MIPATELQYEVRRRINRFNTDYEKKLSISALDYIITEAIQIVIQQSAIVFEVRNDISVNLDPLLKRDVSIPFRKGVKKNISKLPTDFYKLLKIGCVAKKEGCGTKRLIVRPQQTQKIEELLNSPNWTPSYEWEETVALKAGAFEYFIYHNDDFEIQDIFIDYLKLHPSIYTPSLMKDSIYRDANGNSIVKDQGLLLDSEYQKRAVYDIAALIALRDLGDVNGFQTEVNKILFNNNLYLNNFNNQQNN